MSRKKRDERVIAITGASAGVGRATAIEFARGGARIALLARGTEGLAGAQRDVEQAGGEAIAFPTDVADADQVERAAQEIENHWGAPDVWVNCAMVTVFSPTWRITPDEFRRVIATNYLGTVHGTLAALKRMRAAGRGTIVQVGSALSYRAIPLQAPYCASKFAARGFTDALRCELLHEGSPVHLTMVHLAAMNTPQFDWARTHMECAPQPVPPVYQPEVAARAIVWAASARRREVYVGAPTLQAIWASRLAPGLADRLLARSAWRGQLTDGPLAPDRPDNLETPVRSDHGAHGRFSDRARAVSPQAMTSRHRNALLGAGGVLLAALLAPRLVAAFEAPRWRRRQRSFWRW
jgi:NAD(P)-dependent dehydrogenase (short-subunit alcohol dehydrogenase family)